MHRQRTTVRLKFTFTHAETPLRRHSLLPASPGPRKSLKRPASVRTFSVSSSLRDSSAKPPREKVRLVMALPGLCAPFSTCATQATSTHALAPNTLY